MENSSDPVLAAITHPQYRALMDRVFMSITNESWPVEHSARFWEWRYTPHAFIPPYAFSMRWFGGNALSQEQEERLHVLQSFGHVRTLTLERNEEQFQQQHLVVFDMPPRPKPATMFHATPTKHVTSILASGLQPGWATKVNTTKFPETHRWIHLFESREHAIERFLLLPKNKGRIPSDVYTILQVDTAGLDELLCDPFSAHGFVTRAEVIPPEHVTVQNEVVVP
ncbi:hypothetical protein VT84_12180 [Gemmata sp. SH-PL17]|uniref:hypothetical protein n=1 Tax=Gemmata sp. SH-PL17 TaxID=1630693 RepID=UPI00078E58F8|nr:hypothetical protein [Gemmata sp. SH-PL17]AMV25147.1 hypothetical protein VT84_12180 [Gemmata sp. SH-PL17]